MAKAWNGESLKSRVELYKVAFDWEKQHLQVILLLKKAFWVCSTVCEKGKKNRKTHSSLITASHKFLINSSLCDNRNRKAAVASCPYRKVTKHPRIESICITIRNARCGWEFSRAPFSSRGPANKRGGSLAFCATIFMKISINVTV